MKFTLVGCECPITEREADEQGTPQELHHEKDCNSGEGCRQHSGRAREGQVSHGDAAYSEGLTNVIQRGTVHSGKRRRVAGQVGSTPCLPRVKVEPTVRDSEQRREVQVCCRSGVGWHHRPVHLDKYALGHILWA